MKKAIKLILIVFSIFIVTPAQAQEMSINQAYKAIPHKQTTYNLKQSRIKKEDAKYLDHFFFASDLALRSRVMTLRYFYNQNHNMNVESYNKEIDNIIGSFSLIDTPHHLQEVEDTLISALKDQRDFFNELEKTKNTARYNKLKRNYKSHPKVINSHKKLVQAYYKLKQIYPNETSHNKQAFFDHLCALDFI